MEYESAHPNMLYYFLFVGILASNTNKDSFKSTCLLWGEGIALSFKFIQEIKS